MIVSKQYSDTLTGFLEVELAYFRPDNNFCLFSNKREDERGEKEEEEEKVLRILQVAMFTPHTPANPSAANSRKFSLTSLMLYFFPLIMNDFAPS